MGGAYIPAVTQNLNARRGHAVTSPWRGGRFHFTEDRLDLSPAPGKPDIEQREHDAASAVAANEIARVHLGAVGQLNGHSILILAGCRTTRAPAMVRLLMVD